MALFLGPPGWATARRELLDFMVQGKINRGRHTDHLAGRHSIWTNQCPPPPSPYFLQAGCPSCRPTNSVKALKAIWCFLIKSKNRFMYVNQVELNFFHQILLHYRWFLPNYCAAGCPSWCKRGRSVTHPFFHLQFSSLLFTVKYCFSALTLLFWRQEERPACKKISDDVLAC